MAVLMLALGIVLVIVALGAIAFIPWYVGVVLLWIGGGFLLAAGLAAARK